MSFALQQFAIEIAVVLMILVIFVLVVALGHLIQHKGFDWRAGFRAAPERFFFPLLLGLSTAFVHWAVIVTPTLKHEVRAVYHEEAQQFGSQHARFGASAMKISFTRDGSKIRVVVPMVQGEEDTLHMWDSSGTPVLGLRRRNRADGSVIDYQDIPGLFVDRDISRAEFVMDAEFLLGVNLVLNPKVFMQHHRIHERHALLGELRDFYHDVPHQPSWHVSLRKDGERLIPEYWE